MVLYGQSMVVACFVGPRTESFHLEETITPDCLFGRARKGSTFMWCVRVYLMSL